MDANCLTINVEALGIDATTLYYTYSTIAQTLAGAFGILGAFVLFRLQSINQSIKEICTQLFTAVPREIKDKSKQSFALENWEDFLNKIDGCSFMNITFRAVEITGEELENYIELLKQKINLKKAIILYLQQTVCVTAMTIALSLILLPCTPKLAQNVFVSIGFLIIVIFVSILCIYKYMQLILEAL